MKLENLKDLAEEQGIQMPGQDQIIAEATSIVASRHGNEPEEIKEAFDDLVTETEKEAYRVYLRHEAEYGGKVFSSFIAALESHGAVQSLDDVGEALGRHFKAMDKFFLSLAQSRRARAGGTLEEIIRSLFRILDYPFEEQKVINGKPDFIMPSEEHFRNDPLDCIVFTAKRTLRERWRQITTEGTHGLAFFLATIDEDLSGAQLAEMHQNRIYVVCPELVKNANYPNAVNVLSFREFFRDHLDPALDRWHRKGVI